MKTDLYDFIDMMSRKHKLTISADDDNFYVDVTSLKDWFVAGEQTGITFSFHKDGSFDNLIGGV